MTSSRSAALLALAITAGTLGATPAVAGRIVEGTDEVVVELPAGVVAQAYEAVGYRLTVDGGHGRVEVDLFPLASRASFRLPEAGDEDRLGRLAHRLTADVSSRYDAVSRVLGWIAGNVRYELDRSLPQDAESVLARGTAYCTGAARLAIAMLATLEIPAREVPGYVAGEGGGFHRWIEVYYPDRGWVFSDPMRSHHFVPATYVRLASERVASGSRPTGGRLVERRDRLVPVDLVPGLAVDVLSRANDPLRRAATLAIDFGSAQGTAYLQGSGRRYTQLLMDGRAEFLDLAPGRYELRVELEGGAMVDRRVVLQGRERRVLHLALPGARGTAETSVGMAAPRRTGPVGESN